MSPLDYAIIAFYLLATVGVGLYFYRRHQSSASYFVGDRSMTSGHLGMSIVATDVGGGFSIGLGGLGFTMGLSGSWLLFTGLVGAWLSAVLVIPIVKPLADRYGWLTYPDLLEHRFDVRVRTVAAGVSALGYAGFVGAQVLAGSKLAAATTGVEPTHAVAIIALIVVGYTALGGLTAVVFTDSIQWGILAIGLGAIALPAAVIEAGGLAAIRDALPPGHLSLTSVSFGQLASWAVTIIPIWFVGMTLYQRMYAAKDVRTAKRAWFLAGLLEWPLMAFAGAALGMIARVLFPEADPEMGVPLLVRDVLPVGLTGLVLAAYFSAIMSTADSCLLASVGHLVGDGLLRRVPRDEWETEAVQRSVLRWSRALTLLVGFGSCAIALYTPSVLDAILGAYGFMVSGLFVPTVAALYWPRATARGALASMVVGGGLAIGVPAFGVPTGGLEPIFVAILGAIVALVAGSYSGRR